MHKTQHIHLRKQTVEATLNPTCTWFYEGTTFDKRHEHFVLQHFVQYTHSTSTHELATMTKVKHPSFTPTLRLISSISPLGWAQPFKDMGYNNKKEKKSNATTTKL